MVAFTQEHVFDAGSEEECTAWVYALEEAVYWVRTQGRSEKLDYSSPLLRRRGNAHQFVNIDLIRLEPQPRYVLLFSC